jgi:DNA-binding transcriptional LysR family regulator
MEHRQLLNFIALCEEKNFFRAAERRHITQQGLSKSIQELEKEIGAALLDRRRRGVVLTEYGMVLENAAKAYINQHDYILETIRNMVEQRHARLSVGVADTLLPMLMPNFPGGFMERHPEISLLLKTFPMGICQSQVEKQKLQIGIVPGPVDTERFKAFLLRRSRLHIAVGKNHPFAGRKSIKIEELKKTNFISLANDTRLRKIAREPGTAAAGEIMVELSYADSRLIMELLATGRYASFYGPRTENPDQWKWEQEIAIIDLEDAELIMEMYLIVNKRAFINRAAETFIEYANEKLGGGGGGDPKI